MKTDANGKIWGTWREWQRMGRIDANKKLTPQYPAQPDYMLGFTTSRLWGK
jgi:hypothetical protein